LTFTINAKPKNKAFAHFQTHQVAILTEKEKMNR